MQITKSTNDQLMCIAAHGYCLGKSTYIVDSFIEWLKIHWTQLSMKTQNTIMRDTIEAIHDHSAGRSIDQNKWSRLVVWAWENMSPPAKGFMHRQMKNKIGNLNQTLEGLKKC